MSAENFEALLQGKIPTLDDYSEFVLICEKFPPDILWVIAINNTNMHPLLKGVVEKNLAEKIPRKNIDRALSEITTNWLLAVAAKKYNTD